VDGRTAESHGMTLPELAEFLKILKCKNALNLDGGGSTTMWIQGQPEGGIVNMPCDNRRFDHLGERSVANAIVIRKKE
jgi:exopolysaccharide biosynthesis protein